MFIFSYGGRRTLAHAPHDRLTIAKRLYASRIDIPQPVPSVPTINSCPSPTCQCQEMPAGLEIEQDANINGSMAPYAEQVLISTGRSNWISRVEDDNEDGVLLRQMKALLGLKGKYRNVRSPDSILRSRADMRDM